MPRTVILCRLVRVTAIAIFLLVAAANVRTATAQDAPDLTRLGHPSVADRLELNDEQRASIARLLNTRAQTLANTPAAERDKVIENINRELMAVLNDEQKNSLARIETPKNLKFDYAGESWENVLSWFAEQADLTLSHDKLPEQDFVYRDNKSYTTAEAIDLLNSVLLSKGFTLIRRGKLLIVADISERVPEELLPETKPEDLDKFGEFEFVKARFAVGGRPMEAIQNEVKAIISERGKMTLLPTSNQLLIVETAGKLKAINKMIASVPIPKPKEKPKEKPKPKPKEKKAPPPPVLAVYPYKGVDPEAVIKIAESFIGETKTTIDRAAGTISVYTPQANQDVFKATLEKHQKSRARDSELVLNSYELAIGSKSKEGLAELLQRLAPSAQITIDQEKGRVTALGDSVEHAAIARAIKAMKSDATVDVDDGEPTLEVYTVKQIDPEEVAAVLSATVADDDVAIAPSTLTRSVVVRARPKMQAKIKDMVAQMDAAASDEQTSQIQTYPVEESQQANLISIISKLEPTADVSWDNANERLVVIGAPNIQTAVGQIVERLTKDIKPQTKKEMRLYPVEKEQQANVANLLSSTVEDADVTVDAVNERLIVIAEPNDHANVAAVIKKLTDGTAPEAGRVELQSYPIRNSNPESTFALMTELFPDNKMIIDEQSGRLLAWATKDSHIDIKQAVTQLDVDTPNLKQQRLEAYVSPGLDIKALVGQLQPQHAEMILTADPSVNKIMAWGTAAEHKKLAERLKTLREKNPPLETSMQTYPAAPRNVYEIVPLLSATVPNAWLTSDTKTNTLIARATKEDHELIKSTLSKLPSTDDADAKQELVTYDIEPSQTSALSSMVSRVAPRAAMYFSNNQQQLFIYADAADHEKVHKTIAEMSANVSKSERKLKIYTAPAEQLSAISNAISYTSPYASVIERSNERLSVLASPRDHEKIAKLVDETKNAKIPGKIVKSHAVQPHQSDIVSNLLYSIAPGAAYGGTSPNQITLWATADEHKAIEKLIADTKNDGENKVAEVHKVTPQQVGAVIQLIQSATPDAVLADYTSDRVTVWATPEDHDKITTMIDQSKAAKPAAEAMTRFQVYELDGASGRDLMELLEEEMAAGIKMQISSDRERLIVRATDAEHDELGEKIPTLIQQIGEDEKPVNKIYRPKVVSLETIIDVFDDLFPRLLTAVDREGRLVSVTALPSEHEQLQQMFDELERDKTLRLGSTEIRTYDIGSASGEDMREVLSTEIATGVKLQVSDDRERLIVRATPEQHADLASKIPDLVKQLGDQIENKVYRPSVVTPYALEDMFRDVFRNIRAGVDENSGIVAVAAPASTHVELQKMFNELEKGKSSKPIARSFRVKSNANDVEDMLQRLFRRRGISIDGNEGTGAVLVVAPPRDMEAIAELIVKIDESANTVDLSDFKVYQIVNQNPNVVEQFLRRALPAATIEGDSSARSVIVRGSKEDQETAARLIAQLNDANVRETKTYEVKKADTNVVAEMFDQLAPRSRIVTDRPSRTITVSAMPFEHQAMATTLAQLEKGTSRVPVPKTYNVGKAAESVYQAVSQLYMRRDDNVTLTWTPGSESILALAPESAHNAIAEIVKEVNSEGGMGASSELVIYTLKDVDGDAAEETLVNLMAYDPIPPRIQYDYRNGQMMVIASEKQHTLIEDVLSRMKRERRELAFFKMQANDAKRIKTSLESLFLDLPEKMRPLVSTTFDRQELMVQGSAEQLNQMRSFLNANGEYFPMPGVEDTRTVRTVQFSGDIEASMKQIEEVWPKIRGNQLKIVFPSDDATGGSLLTPVPGTPRAPTSIGAPDSTPGVMIKDTNPDAAPSPQPPTQPTEAGAQDTPQTGTSPPGAVTVNPPGTAPVVILPGNGKLTIRSEDPKALNELEKLLRMFGGGSTGYDSFGSFGGPADDVAVYGLRNAGAVDTAQLLQTFIKGMPEWSYIGETIVIPDPRLNALVVHAPDESSREMIESILKVLDSDNPMSDGQWSKPRIVPVTKTSATRVLGIIRSVYKSQLTTGSKRESIEIPQGLAPEVAAVLEQINAGTSGPVLTLEADEITNSIIVLAPPQLADEVEALIKQLDQGAAETERRGLRVIPLQHVRSELLEEVLQELSKGSPAFSPKEEKE